MITILNQEEKELAKWLSHLSIRNIPILRAFDNHDSTRNRLWNVGKAVPPKPQAELKRLLKQPASMKHYWGLLKMARRPKPLPWNVRKIAATYSCAFKINNLKPHKYTETTRERHLCHAWAAPPQFGTPPNTTVKDRLTYSAGAPLKMRRRYFFINCKNQ